jgi:hypothetical protein
MCVLNNSRGIHRELFLKFEQVLFLPFLFHKKLVDSASIIEYILAVSPTDSRRNSLTIARKRLILLQDQRYFHT